ncbi:MAG: hypothetical protein QUV06_14015 [Cyanobium sp. CZS 48M]|nr:hypothetical protein [Cyanobium sp. CZS48M]
MAEPVGVHQLCSCGRSRHGWFCELHLEQACTVMFCGCGHPGFMGMNTSSTA